MSVLHFKNGLTNCDLHKMEHFGAFFSGLNGQEERDKVGSRIDRAFYNIEWSSHFFGDACGIHG